jgi:hypothetical protein
VIVTANQVSLRSPMLAGRLHCKISRMAISSRAEVISIVADTAMPAAASGHSSTPRNPA